MSEGKTPFFLKALDKKRLALLAKFQELKVRRRLHRQRLRAGPAAFALALVVWLKEKRTRDVVVAAVSWGGPPVREEGAQETFSAPRRAGARQAGQVHGEAAQEERVAGPQVRRRRSALGLQSFWRLICAPAPWRGAAVAA